MVVILETRENKTNLDAAPKKGAASASADTPSAEGAASPIADNTTSAEGADAPVTDGAPLAKGVAMVENPAASKVNSASVATGTSTPKKGRGWNILGGILIALVILVFLPLPALRLAGFTPYSVISGSMEPAIPTGSLVLVQEENPANIRVGDIVAFYSNGSIITHRAMEIDAAKKIIVTKGDANAKIDPQPASFSAIEGIVVTHIPGLGFAYQVITGLWGKILGIGLVILAVGCFALARRRSTASSA